MALKQTLAAVALATTAMTGAAGAATISVDGGAQGIIPGYPEDNEALAPLGLPAQLAGYFGSAIRLTTPGRVTFTLLGYEAGNINTFTAGMDSLGGGGGIHFDPSGAMGSFTQTLMAGLVNFSFSTNGEGGLTVSNGSNTSGATGTGVNFFASIAGAGTARSGTSVYLFFDDQIERDDDNHDDLVVRVDVAPVPLPAAGGLMVLGMGALAALKRRRKAA